MTTVNPHAKPGPCIHRPPSPGQSLCSCGHQQIEMEYAARIAEFAFEEGARQAIEWLRADYPYGEGPEWRERGCEWISDRLAEHTRAIQTKAAR